jgi:hypothetical protein
LKYFLFTLSILILQSCTKPHSSAVVINSFSATVTAKGQPVTYSGYSVPGGLGIWEYDASGVRLSEPDCLISPSAGQFSVQLTTDRNETIQFYVPNTTACIGYASGMLLPGRTAEYDCYVSFSAAANNDGYLDGNFTITSDSIAVSGTFSNMYPMAE